MARPSTRFCLELGLTRKFYTNKLARESIPTQKGSVVEKISIDEERAFELLVPRHKASAIKMDDFKDIYGEAEVERDKLNVETKKARIKEQGSPPLKRAQILEALLAEQIELSDWFGPNTMTLVPAEYDDLYNGIDTAVELQNEEGGFDYMAMGIDVTSSPDAIKTKLARIKEHIIKGDLTQMKYFASEKNTSRKPGPEEKMPQLIIGAEVKTITELSELWLAVNKARLTNKDMGPISEETALGIKERLRNAKKKLAEHRVQVLILEEIEKQLVAFSKFANMHGKLEISRKYHELLKLVREILKDKEISDEDQEKNDEDGVSNALIDALDEFDGSGYDLDLDWPH